MSWESTVEYCRILNQEVGKRLGGLHSARILMHSVEFGEIESLMRDGDCKEAPSWSGLVLTVTPAGMASGTATGLPIDIF